MMNIKLPMHSQPDRRSVAGVGLIEVLVAIAVLAFGMLGIAALQAAALRSSQSSINRNEAVAQSYAILDAMRANRANALIGKYDRGTYNTNDEDSTWACGVPELDGTLARADLNEWMTRLRSTQGLGDSACAIIGPADGIPDAYEVHLRWDDSRGDVGRNGTSSSKQTTLTVSRL